MTQLVFEMDAPITKYKSVTATTNIAVLLVQLCQWGAPGFTCGAESLGELDCLTLNTFRMAMILHAQHGITSQRTRVFSNIDVRTQCLQRHTSAIHLHHHHLRHHHHKHLRFRSNKARLFVLQSSFCLIRSQFLLLWHWRVKSGRWTSSIHVTSVLHLYLYICCNLLFTSLLLHSAPPTVGPKSLFDGKHLLSYLRTHTLRNLIQLSWHVALCSWLDGVEVSYVYFPCLRVIVERLFTNLLAVTSQNVIIPGSTALKA